MREDAVTIRSIQHYLYCPHRWGLIEIGGCWAENYYVTKANLMHERVHDPERQYIKKNRKVFTGISVYNDNYNIYGVTDCLEAVNDENGVELQGMPGKYRLNIVEYKPTQPLDADCNEDDLLQVFAQKLCVDYIFGGDATGELYYANVKKRVALPLQRDFAEYDALLKEVLGEMQEFRQKGTIPKVNRKQKCRGCSFKDMCMPKLTVRQNVRDEIKEDSDEKAP